MDQQVLEKTSADQAYGGLMEGVYVAAHEFERVIQKLEWILTDDRWKVVGAGFDDPFIFLNSLKLDDLRGPIEDKKRIALLIKKVMPDVSNREAAKATGIGSSTVNRLVAPDGAGTGKKPNEINVGKVGTAPSGAPPGSSRSGGAVAKLAVRAENRQAKDDATKAAFTEIKGNIPAQLYVGDFRERASIIPNDSVDLVFTDPPYDRDSVPLYGDAAKEAARILKPGGRVICYCGHLILPDVLPLMMAHLRYFWIGAHVHDGGPMSRMVEFGIIAGFKPLLWFVKGHRGDRQSLVHDTVLVKREKDFHPWQQAVATAEHFISALTSDTGTVVDFFAGGGTTIVAAKNLKRNWCAFEVNETAVNRIVERVA